MTIHWFFSIGNTPRPALYYRDENPSVWAERSFATTALMDLGWPVPSSRRKEIVPHLLGTPDLKAPVRGGCESPIQLFQAEMAQIFPEVADRFSTEHFVMLEKRDQDSIWRVVETVLTNVADNDEVVIETTNGIRSISTGFLLASGLLLAHRKNVNILAVTYAEMGADKTIPEGIRTTLAEGSPVFDLLPFLQLFDWSHAVRAMSQYLDPRPILGLLRSSKSLPEGVGNVLQQLGAALALNFPVDIEQSLRDWNSINHITAPTPAARIALHHVSGQLASLFTPGSSGNEVSPVLSGLEEKRLDFDLALIRQLIEAQRFSDASRAVREWIVNAVLLAWGLGADWLEQSIRGKAEKSLNGIPKKSSPEVLELRELWQEASAARNAVSHLRYNKKHEEWGVDRLASFLGGVEERLRHLRQLSPNPFALSRDPVERRHYLSNAFSLGMLDSSDGVVGFKKLSLEKAKIEAVDRTSVVGHTDTAALFSHLLNREVPCDRQDIRLTQGDTLLVGQYSGPRLSEGATQLPEGAKIVWFLVECW